MARIKRGMTRHRRHKKVLAMVKGHMSTRGHLFRTANQEMMHALMYAYRDRRSRKRDMRGLWIVRINAASREHGLPYNRFMAGMTTLGLEIDRKMLAEMAVNDPLGFATLAYRVRGEEMPADVRSRYVQSASPGAGAAPEAAETTVQGRSPVPQPAPLAAETTIIAPTATEDFAPLGAETFVSASGATEDFAPLGTETFASASAATEDFAPVGAETFAGTPDEASAAVTHAAPTEVAAPVQAAAPTETLAEQEAEAAGAPLEHAGTADRVDRKHGDGEQDENG